MVDREGTPIPHKDLGTVAPAEHSFGLEAGKLSKYRSTFLQLLPQVEAKFEDPSRYDPFYSLNVRGEHEGTRYAVRLPHMGPGKHAFVGIVDLNGADGDTTSAVIRHNSEDAKKFLEVAAAHPFVKKFVPELYGIEGNWTIMEQLHGLELDELQVRLQEDEDFRRKYVGNVFDVVTSAAESGLQINDVGFIDGHNVMVNPDDASLKFIEQRTLVPTILTPHEVVTRQLLEELTDASDKREWRTDYAMQLMQAAIGTIGADNLYIKERAVKPTHPQYRNVFLTQQWGELSEDMYQSILNNPDTRENMTVTWFGKTSTVAISDETVAAAINGNRREFEAAIAERKFKKYITDKEDPRYGVVVLPDDSNM